MITHDPLQLKDYDPEWEVDFGAEKIIAATRGPEKIAVEVKSFLHESFAYEFHQIIGQYVNYRSALKRRDPTRKLFVAVPIQIFEADFQRIGIQNAIEDEAMCLLIYHPITKKVVQWKK